MSTPAKLTIAYSALLEKLRGFLASYPECQNIHIDGFEVYPMQQDGANWDVTKYRCSGDKNNLSDCLSKFSNEIHNLRMSYDVVSD